MKTYLAADLSAERSEPIGLSLSGETIPAVANMTAKSKTRTSPLGSEPSIVESETISCCCCSR
jgi:hypothetical protein